MNQFRFSVLNSKDLPNVVDCVTKVFLYDEPMTKNLHISLKEFRHFVNIICKRCTQDGLSYVCKNGRKVVGFCLNKDLIQENSEEFNSITKKMNPILGLLGELDNSYLRFKLKSPGKFFHLFMAGSFREYRNKGIVSEMIVRSLNVAKKKKYKFVVAEATNIKSQSLLKKFGFIEKNKISYSKFKFKNSKIFRDIGENYCKLMEIKIN